MALGSQVESGDGNGSLKLPLLNGKKNETETGEELYYFSSINPEKVKYISLNKCHYVMQLLCRGRGRLS